MNSFFKRHRYPIILWTIFLLHLLISYYGVVVYRYQVAPGDDTLAHLQLMEYLKQHSVFWPTNTYPPGFHYLILALGSIFHASPSHVLAAIWPLFIVGSGVSIYFFSKKAFGLPVALLTYGFFALICPQPLQTAYDGGWPNIIATGIFLPISLVFWTRLWQRFNWSDFAKFLLGGLLIIYTHHLSTVMWLAILLVSGTVMVVVRAVRGDGWRRLVLPAIWFAGVIIMYLIFTRTEAFAAARTLMNFGLSTNDSPIWPIKTYLSSLSGIIFQLSLIGVVWAVWKVVKADRFSGKSGYLIVLVSWFLVYFVVSRLPVAEPGRAARDLAAPSSILAALTLAWIQSTVKVDKVVWSTLVICVIGAAVTSFSLKTASQLKYNPMIRFSKADAEALSFINRTAGPYPYLVWARNGFWSIEAKGEINAGKVRLVSADGLEEVAEGRSCGLVGYYKPGIWQEFLQDRSELDRYANESELRATFLVEDSTKVWYRLCKK